MSDKQKPTLIQSAKGMHDILPADAPVWERVRRAVKEIAEFYNFARIETPAVERAELFERAVGETTDIVEKQMFALERRGADRYVLRPEATAGIARAYLEHGLSHLGSPLKLYTDGSFFRYEQPQAGRFREFHQANFEIISQDADPIYDVQIIGVTVRLLGELKLKDVTVSVNTIGCKVCRVAYRRELKTYCEARKNGLCKDCKRRLAVNPLRILDCKEEAEQKLKAEAPIIIDHLCAACHSHFRTVLEYLDELGLPYTLDHYLVRGLDYYTKTVFELLVPDAAFSLGGGGRYDYLIGALGGREAPAVGAALGIERIIEVLRLRNVSIAPKPRPKLFLIHIGELAKKKSLRIIEALREQGIPVRESLGRESLKAQLKLADKMGSPLALIFGQKEAFEETIILRNLESGAQETVPLMKMAEAIRRKLK